MNTEAFSILIQEWETDRAITGKMLLEALAATGVLREDIEEDVWLQMLPSNRAFSLSNPLPEDVDVLDIATHLSGLNRYHGGTLLTVAEHSVRCSRRAPPGLELEALHHDSHEAYLGDIAGPMKRLLGPEYAALEKKVDQAVRWAFKLPFPPSPEIKEIDRRMLQTERLQLFGAEPKPWGLDAEPYDEKIESWPRYKACDLFVAWHNELIGGRA